MLFVAFLATAAAACCKATSAITTVKMSTVRTCFFCCLCAAGAALSLAMLRTDISRVELNIDPLVVIKTTGAWNDANQSTIVNCFLVSFGAR